MGGEGSESLVSALSESDSPVTFVLSYFLKSLSCAKLFYKPF